MSTRRRELPLGVVIMGGFCGLGAIFFTIGYLLGNGASLSQVFVIWSIVAAIYLLGWVFSSYT